MFYIFKIHDDVDNGDNNKLINSTEQNPSWEASSSLANQEIPQIVWNLMIHYRVYKSPPFEAD